MTKKDIILDLLEQCPEEKALANMYISKISKLNKPLIERIYECVKNGRMTPFAALAALYTTNTSAAKGAHPY